LGRYFRGTSSGFFGAFTFLLTLPMVTTVSSTIKILIFYLEQGEYLISRTIPVPLKPKHAEVENGARERK
jgi:hypothetical protein